MSLWIFIEVLQALLTLEATEIQASCAPAAIIPHIYVFMLFFFLLTRKYNSARIMFYNHNNMQVKIHTALKYSRSVVFVAVGCVSSAWEYLLFIECKALNNGGPFWGSK